MATMPTDVVVRVKMIKERAATLLQGGLVASFFNFFQGRTTTFAIIYGIVGVVFTIVAVWGITHGKDVSQIGPIILALAGYLGALQAMLLAHSSKEDWVELQHRKLAIEEKKLDAANGIDNPPAAPGFVSTGPGGGNS